MSRSIEFGQWETVRVTRPFPIGGYFEERPPQVGERGTIVHIDDSATPEVLYTVECTDADGYTVWLAEFTAQEIERV